MGAVLTELDDVDIDNMDDRLIAAGVLVAGAFGLRFVERHSRDLYGRGNRQPAARPAPQPRTPRDIPSRPRRRPARRPPPQPSWDDEAYDDFEEDFGWR